MAAHIGQPAPSRRFIKVYLLTWGLLAVGALAYLTFLAFPPQPVSPPQAAVKPPTPTSGHAAGDSKTIAEVQGSLGEIRKDVSALKTTVVENEKVVKTRLTALEERVSTIGSTAPDGAGEKAAPKEREPSPGEISGKPQADPSAPSDGTAGVKTSEKASPAPIQTGSLQPKTEAKEEIVFGEPVVIKGGQEFAVQLAAAASVSTLKQSWEQLAERHAGALGSLQPRVVAPRAEGGFYRLVVGPLPTKADAERLCSDLRIGPKACFPTPYTGAPL